MWLDYPLQKTGFIKKLTVRFPGFFQSLTVLTVYVFWILLFKVISLTFITYFVMSSSESSAPVSERGETGFGSSSLFEEVNEALGSSEVALLALCAFLFVLLIRLLRPYYSLLDESPSHQLSTSNEIFTPQRFENQFLPGFLHGSVLAMGVTLAFLLSGIYHYLGFFVQTDHAPLAVAAIMIRVLSIALFVYCEEFIFRQKILMSLARRGPTLVSEKGSEYFHNLSVIAFTGLLYVAVKFLQFDLSWMQGLTLFLMSIALGLRALSSNDFILAAGFWAALLIVFHPLLSLPIFGHDFSGLILIKYQAIAPEAHPEFWEPTSTYGETIRFLTGGAGGPLASFAFQLLLIFDIGRGAIRYKNSLFRVRRSR